jgi:NitT/TauT family transport system substrate-binding protein
MSSPPYPNGRRLAVPIIQGRRHFLSNLVLAGAAGLGSTGAVTLGGARNSVAAEPPPEITTIRIQNDPAACIAPLIVQELLRAEGFTDVRYVDVTEADVRAAEGANVGFAEYMIAIGEVDFARDFAPSHVAAMEAGLPITILAGLHSGCFEVLGKDDIRDIADLKGRTVGVYGSGDERLLKIMTSLVGLDPAKDIRWVTGMTHGPEDLFVAGKIDAYIALPPLLQDVRSHNIGHVIASSIADRPWSQYFCCMLATGTAFAQKYPIATKRVLRAILKAVDLCASDPKQIAQLLVTQGYTDHYDYALQMLNETHFDLWRDYDPNDTLLFYALRLHEAGLIKSSPQKLISEHTDWRFLNELKRELKT